MSGPRMIIIDGFWVSETDVLGAVLESALASGLTVRDLSDAANIDAVKRIEDWAESVDAVIELKRSIGK